MGLVGRCENFIILPMVIKIDIHHSKLAETGFGKGEFFFLKW